MDRDTFGSAQGSVIEPLLFNIYINNLLFLTENTDVCSYEDDTTFYACGSDLQFDLICKTDFRFVI